MKRRLLALLLCLCMAVMLLPTAAWATGDTQTNDDVASVTSYTSGTEPYTQYFASFEEAWKAATANNVESATVTLLKDVTVKDKLDDVHVSSFTLSGGEDKHTLTISKEVAENTVFYGFTVYSDNFTVENININSTGANASVMSVSDYQPASDSKHRTAKIYSSSITVDSAVAAYFGNYDVEINNSVITSTGATALSVSASNFNSKTPYSLNIDNSQISATGDTAGISGGGNDGALAVDENVAATIQNRTTITAGGENNRGIMVERGACVNLTGEGTSVEATGKDGTGIMLRVGDNSSTADGTVELNEGAVVFGKTHGVQVWGIGSTAVAEVVLNGATVKSDNYGVYVDCGKVTAKTGKIINDNNDGGTGLYIYGDRGTATISEGVTISGYNCGINANIPITISGGDISGTGTGVATAASETATTISGGKIKGQTALAVNGTVDISGDVEIEGTRYGVSVNASRTVNISGGSFKATDSVSYGLYVSDGGTAVLSGGTFDGALAGVWLGNGTVDSLLEDGYAYYDKNDYRLDGSANELEGEVTVKDAKQPVTLTLTAESTNEGVKVTVSGVPADAVEGSVIAYCYKGNDAGNKKDVSLAKVSGSDDWTLEVPLDDAGGYNFTAEYAGSKTYDKAKTAEPVYVYFQGKRADNPVITLTVGKDFIVGPTELKLTVEIANPLEQVDSIKVGYQNGESFVEAEKQPDNTWTINLPDESKMYSFIVEYTGIKKFETEPRTWNSNVVNVEAVKSNEQRVSIKPSESQLEGAGTVTLTVNMANMPAGGTLTVICKDNENISVTKVTGEADVWTAVLPESEAEYTDHTFIATYTAGEKGTAGYFEMSGACVVRVFAPKHQHVWAPGWSMDNTHHWHNCTAADCTESAKADYQKHTWNEGVETTAPTATTAGEKTFTCTVCGQKKTEPIPATGSSAGLTRANAAKIIYDVMKPSVNLDGVTLPADCDGLDASIQTAIKAMLAKGWILPNDENTFGPNNTITRAEAAKIVCLVRGITGNDSLDLTDIFTDVPANYFAKPFIAGLYAAGVISDSTDKLFYPSELATEADLRAWLPTSSSGNGGGSSGGGSSGGGSSNTTTSTTTNTDGSTTTTTENKTTGTVTETTKSPDGSQTVVETKKDGTVTTTETDKDGNKTETVEKTDGSSVTTVQQKDGTSASVTTDADGKVEAEVKLTDAAVAAAQESGTALALPIPEVQATRSSDSAPAVTVKTGSKEPVKVEIPTANVTPGTVAVLVKADGTEEVIKTSVPTADGVAVPLPDGATVKIVDNSKDFADVSDAHWASDAVDFASARELFSGTSATSFSPEEDMTRAMLMTVLARFDGEDTSGGATWYEKGMDWAVANGISDGSSPDSAITREQLAVMLYRYSGSPTASGGLDRFNDADDVSDYALEAMRWAVENGVINGFGNGQLGPKALATRAQVAQMLKNFIEM